MGIANDLKRGLVFNNNTLLSINHCPWKSFHQFTRRLLLWMPAIMISQAGMTKINIKCCLQLHWSLIKENKSSWSHKNSVCNRPAYPASKPYDVLQNCSSRAVSQTGSWELEICPSRSWLPAGQRWVGHPAGHLHPMAMDVPPAMAGTLRPPARSSLAHPTNPCPRAEIRALCLKHPLALIVLLLG